MANKISKSKVSGALKNYIVDGAFLIVLGLAMTIWPTDSLAVFFICVGAALILMGVIKGILFFVRKEKEEKNIADLLIGILQIILGVILIVSKDFFITHTPLLVSVIMAYGAILMIVRAIKVRRGTTAKFMIAEILGILSLVYAAVVFSHPIVLEKVMIQTAGIGMMFVGLSLIIVLSFKDKSKDEETEDEKDGIVPNLPEDARGKLTDGTDGDGKK